jgi:choice-of-anchor A domain-containing protein
MFKPRYLYAAVAVVSLTSLAQADVFPNLGAAGTYTILALEGGSLSINSATSITGDVGIGKNVTTATAQKVDTFIGTAFVHSTSSASFLANYKPATFAPSGGIQFGPGAVDTALEQANADALSASSAAAGLGSSTALGAVTTNMTLVSTGILNVYSMTSLDYNSDTLTLQSRVGFDDFFVINVLGDFDFSQSTVALTNGTTQDHVLFNFPNAVAIDINKSTSVFNGTILAPTSAIIYHNPATFNGQIISSDITLHSDFNIAGPPSGGGGIPEPATLGVLMLGGMGLLVRRRRVG